MSNHSKMWYTTIKPNRRGRSTERIYYDEMYSSEGLASWDYDQVISDTIRFYPFVSTKRKQQGKLRHLEL